MFGQAASPCRAQPSEKTELFGKSAPRVRGRASRQYRFSRIDCHVIGAILLVFLRAIDARIMSLGCNRRAVRSFWFTSSAARSGEHVGENPAQRGWHVSGVARSLSSHGCERRVCSALNGISGAARPRSRAISGSLAGQDRSWAPSSQSVPPGSGWAHYSTVRAE